VRKYAAAGSARWIISGSDIEGGLTAGEATRRFGGASSSIALPPVSPESEAFCFTTSGSTGSPKLCPISHRNVAAGILGSQAGMGGDADDVVLCPVPMSHIAFLTQVTTSLVQGRTAVACDFEATSCFQLVKDRGVTVLGMSPTMWGLLMERNSFPDPDFRLRRALYGSSAMPAHWAKELISTFSGCELAHLYGMTESSGHITVLPPDLVVEKAGSAGLAQPLVDALAILDPDGKVLEAGEVGEICARGPFVTAGYIDRPEDTAETLRGGWLHSGDLGHLDSDGCLWISGRMKDQINRGGLKIGAREVEEIIEGIASVTGVAVVGIPDPFLTERVAAVVEVAPGSSLDAAAIRAEVAGQLADYKVPERVLLVETLPRSDMQKPDKPAIRKLLAETS
jgi:acyl-CoA synthetase (AMP-forming)/AMP-acid ligase II